MRNFGILIMVSVLVISACGRVPDQDAPTPPQPVPPNASGTAEHDLKGINVSLKIDTAGMTQWAEQLALQLAPSGILIGLECASADTELSVAISPAGQSLPSFLDELVKKDPTYSWKYSDHVVNIFPRVSIIDTEDIMNEMIPELDMENKTRAEIIESAMSAMGRGKSQIIAQRAEGKMLWRLFYLDAYEIMDSSVVKRHSLSVRNITVRDLLNEIARKDNECWTVQLHPDTALGIRVLHFWPTIRNMDELRDPRTIPSSAPIDTKAILDEANRHF